MWEAWDAVAAGERSQGKNAGQESVIVAISRRNNDDDNNNDNDNSNNLFKVVFKNFEKKRKNTGNVEMQDKTNIENTDQGKTGGLGEQYKQIMLVQSKVKHATQVDKKRS